MVVEFLAVDFDVLFFADAFLLVAVFLLGVLFVATGWRADDAEAEVAPPRVRVDRMVLVVLLLIMVNECSK